MSDRMTRSVGIVVVFHSYPGYMGPPLKGGPNLRSGEEREKRHDYSEVETEMSVGT